MNDKIIINTISKIHFIITSLLLVIFFLLSILFIVLQNGLYIENISTPKLKIKQLYIKWNENLDVSIKEIKIIKDRNSASSELSIDRISSILKKLPHFYNIFEKIAISNILIDDTKASFQYVKGEDGHLFLESPYLSLKASLSFESSLLNIFIETLKDKNRDISIHGNIILDINQKNATSSLFVDIHNDISLNILLFTNKKKLHYKINSLKKIKNISYLMKLLDLDKELNYWAYEAIDFTYLGINDVYGWLNFNDLNNAYKNIYIQASGKNFIYAYNKNLNSIHTKKTDLIFKSGILYIYPKQASTYKSQLGKSWVKIDFTQKENLLTLKLLFDGKLDKETLTILKQYKIKIPFLQNTGKIETDLTLKINLNTMSVDAKGDFFTKEANFKYYGYDIDIFDAHIILNNYKVTAKKILAKYQDNITTIIDLTFDADTSKGKIDFFITKLVFENLDLSLVADKKSLNATYTLSANKDNLFIHKSLWNYKDILINVDKLQIPFDLDKAQAKIPKTSIESKELGLAYVTGLINLKEINFDLDINLEKIYFQNIRLINKKIKLHLKYNKQLTIHSDERINFYFKEKASFLNPSTIEIKDDILKLEETYLNFGDIFKTKVSAEYSFAKKEGYLQTRRARMTTENFGLLYFNKEKTKFKIKTDLDGKLNIKSKDLEISFWYKNGNWNLDATSMFLLSLNSTFLKNYHLRDGNISFWKKKDDKKVHFSSQIKYPYKLMVKDNFEYEKYFINGSIDPEIKKISFNVNNSIDIKIEKDAEVNIHDIGLNINAFIDLVNSLDVETSNTNNLNVAIEAQNSHLYISENRHVISDNIYLYYYNHILTAGLLYKDGIAGLKYENNHFNAYGENFNDLFMEKLFALSKFEGGNFKFNLSGSTKKYDGIFRINGTTIIKYKVLNNILAFINTIPSLITFSIPEYSAKGLKINTSYMKFTAEKDNFYINDIYLNAKELTITGRGEASFKYNTIDTELTLKTDLGSKVSKIPLLGHLLMGKDSLSTTLQVSGALDNPDINSLLVKDIAVAPLNILLRAITLPYYLIKSIDQNTSKVK